MQMPYLHSITARHAPINCTVNQVLFHEYRFFRRVSASRILASASRGEFAAGRKERLRCCSKVRIGYLIGNQAQSSINIPATLSLSLSLSLSLC